MKWIITIPAILLFALAGCGKDKQSTNELITVDVTVSYPKKELILQDFMDVEYIPLETKDDFICQGLVLAIGKDIILARNRIRDGDIFIYDRKTGKGLKKINREGQGGEEYTFIQRIVLDEKHTSFFLQAFFPSYNSLRPVLHKTLSSGKSSSPAQPALPLAANPYISEISTNKQSSRWTLLKPSWNHAAWAGRMSSAP